MNTILAISGLGVFCLIAEIFSLRKLLIPVAILGLIAILGLTISEYNLPSTHFNNMVIVDRFSVSFSSLFIVLTIFLVALSGDYYKEHQSKLSDYVAIKIFLLAGAVAMVSLLLYFNNTIYVFFIETKIVAPGQPLTLGVIAYTASPEVVPTEDSN